MALLSPLRALNVTPARRLQDSAVARPFPHLGRPLDSECAVARRNHIELSAVARTHPLPSHQVEVAEGVELDSLDRSLVCHPPILSPRAANFYLLHQFWII